MRRFSILILTTLFLLVSLVNGTLAMDGSGNLTLEERVASLEQNLTLAQRQLDIALKRTSLLLSELEQLKHTINRLQINNTRLSEFAVPSAPLLFKIERIRRARDGNYTVTLRWENLPNYEKVTQFVVWHAPKEGKYVADQTVNQTVKRIVRVELPGFKEGEEIVFKLFAKNDAGQGKPSYVETTIRGYAPYLMSKIKIGGVIGLLLLVGVVLAGVKLRKWNLRGERNQV